MGPPDNQKRTSFDFLIPTILLTVIASWLRFHNLGGDSFWLDEIFTINTARLGFIGGLNNLHHPPFGYWLTTGFLTSFGELEFVARLSSAIAGILAVPMLAVLGKVSGQHRVGLWAAFLLAIAPFHIRYSQEARQYGWLMVFSLATYICVNTLLKRINQ